MTAIETPTGRTPPDLKALTTLRFFAAAWVVLYTAWESLAVSGTPAVVAKGYLGVEVFFVLSGFILSHVYLEQAGERRLNYGGFLWARIARVYPLHIATLLAMIALGLAAGVAGIVVDASLSDWRSLPAQLTLTHAWGLAPTSAFNHPSWSISAEWFAYLTFPIFAAVAWGLRKRPWAATGLAATLLVALYLIFPRLAGFELTQATIRWGALRIVPCFALGCGLYLLHRAGGVRRAGLWSLVFAVAVIASAALNLWDGVTVLAAGGLILSMGSLENARAGLLASRFGVWLGEISYAVYMVCAPWLLVGVNVAARLTGAEDKRLHIIVWLAVVLALPVVAALAHHLIERPCRKGLRGLADRRAARSTATKARTGFA